MAKKKWKKRITGALKAGLTAYAASKMMGKGVGHGIAEEPELYKKDYMHDLESVAPKKLKGHPGGWNQESGTFSSPPMTLKRKAKLWWEKLQGGNPYKKSGGSIKAYQGQLVKSETRGTGAAVKGTTHEVMPGMNAAKAGKMIKAKQGYYSEEDESIGMRLGKKKTKHDKKVARDESYGKWGNRKKDWKVKKASHGTMVRTRGSNPDSSWTTQGGEVKVATKLNGVLTTRTW